MRLITFYFLALCFSFISLERSEAAGAADIVEQEFVLEGQVAHQMAELLGLLDGDRKELSLPWDKDAGKRNCSYGQRSSEATWTHCDDIPQYFVYVDYRALPKEALIFRGRWLDMRTASGPRLYEYSVPSPAFPSLDAVRGDWQAFARAANGSCRRDDGQVIGSPADTSSMRLRLQCVPLYDGSIRLLLSLDFETPNNRERKLREQRKNISLVD